MGSKICRCRCRCPPLPCSCQCPLPSTENKSTQKETSPPPLPPPSGLAIVLSRAILQKVDVTSLQRVAETIDFESLIMKEINFREERATTAQDAAGVRKFRKESNSKTWNERHTLHGDASALITYVNNELHGYIESSISKEIGEKIDLLHYISLQADEVLQRRLSIIASEEQKILELISKEQQVLIQQILKNANLQVTLSEEECRLILQEVIRRLEVEMSKYLDDLQLQVENEKIRVTNTSQNSMKRIEIEIRNAKKQLNDFVQQVTMAKHQEIFNEISAIYKEKTSLTIGYEQFRELTLKMYAAVGDKTRGQGANNIPERNKFIADIAKNNSLNIPKRTVYIENNVNPSQQDHKGAK